MNDENNNVEIKTDEVSQNSSLLVGTFVRLAYF